MPWWLIVGVIVVWIVLVAIGLGIMAVAAAADRLSNLHQEELDETHD